MDPQPKARRWSPQRLAVPIVVISLAVVAVAVWRFSDSNGSGDSGDPTGAESADAERDGDATTTVDPVDVTAGVAREFGPAPDVPDEPWSEETNEALDQAIEALAVGTSPSDQLNQLVETGDARLGWALADLLRFSGQGEAGESVTGAVQRLLPEAEINSIDAWGTTVDHLIAWDLPVPDDYVDFKRAFYGRLEPQWGELFEGGDDIDWRHVSWGGVGIDSRELGSQDQCRCIPALDDPVVTPAEDGDWYPDDRLVFGVVVNDEARAYPKNIMEVHEMVNDTLGGRRIGIPYCTLCGSAQAYFTDELSDDLVEEYGPPVFRTSGLLIRSNKMMYELNSRSFVDTFVGNAASGPLAEAGVTFAQVSVVTSTWAEWKAAHPDTTIVAEDGGIGRRYDLDPLRGRDDDGPIFPIGDVDPRLPVQEPILGLFTDDGDPIAIHVAAATGVLEEGGQIEIEGLEVQLDGSGLRAARDGADVGGHQAFWFAWSQFHPDTNVWPLDYVDG